MTPSLNIDTLKLKKGAHKSLEDGACLLEAVAYIAGEPWTDHPECVSPVISAFLRAWNDDSDDINRQELKRYIPRLVGSVGTVEQEETLAWMATDWLVRVQAPAWLRLAGLASQAETLESLQPVDAGNCPNVLPVLKTVRENANAVREAARAAVREATGEAAWAAVGEAVGVAAQVTAWDAVRAAARDAVRAAVGEAARVAAQVAVREAAGAAAQAAVGEAARAAAQVAVREAAWAAVGEAVGVAAQVTAWDAVRAAAWAAARDAVREAARYALAPTVLELRVSAHDLVDQMLTVTENQ